MIRAALLVVVAASLVGCQDPYGKAQRSRPERQSPTPVSRIEPAESPDHAARAFATLWSTWDWRSAGARQRQLAALAAGDLASNLRVDARSVRNDAALARDQLGSRGNVVAVDLETAVARAVGIVVTREQSYTRGRADLGGKRYRVYLLELGRRADGWKVIRWKPQQ